MVDKEKRGEEGNWKKIEYLENDKSFLNEKHFSYFFKGYHLVKKRKDSGLKLSWLRSF